MFYFFHYTVGNDYHFPMIISIFTSLITLCMYSLATFSIKALDIIITIILNPIRLTLIYLQFLGVGLIFSSFIVSELMIFQQAIRLFKATYNIADQKVLYCDV